MEALVFAKTMATAAAVIAGFAMVLWAMADAAAEQQRRGRTASGIRHAARTGRLDAYPEAAIDEAIRIEVSTGMRACVSCGARIAFGVAGAFVAIDAWRTLPDPSLMPVAVAAILLAAGAAVHARQFRRSREGVAK